MIFRLLLLLSAPLLIGAVQTPAPPITLSPEASLKEGRALVEKILSQQPAENVTNSGVLKILNAAGKRTAVPVRFTVLATATNWQSIYEAIRTNRVERLLVLHNAGQASTYYYDTNFSASRVPLPGDIPVSHLSPSGQLSGTELNAPFAGSDFGVADLGLEFFHWPQQRLLKLEMRRGQSCKVLESTSPEPAKGSYSRVVSWIDNDSDGIVHAEAYDFQNRLLKEFDPLDFKKVNGQWQLQEMEINNRQTDSRTRIEFDLGSK